jgi:hypothetical protein
MALSRSTSVLALMMATTALPAAAAAPVVDIGFTLDDARRLVVRYRAPESVTHLDFLLADERFDKAFRAPMMKPLDDCGTLVPGGVTLRHGPGCENGTRFAVQPRVLGLDAMYEAAQPTSDGGVLLHTGYYAAAASGAAIRWTFEPARGDYGIDDSRRHDAAWSVEPRLVFDGPSKTADQRDSDEWLSGQHAQHYVFLGHSPIQQADGLLWVRDPALPQAIVDTVGRAGPLAWRAFAKASGRVPEGPAAIVMMAASRAGTSGWGNGAFHGDRTDGNMLRLSFFDPSTTPRPADLEQWSKFVAHETAHQWNHGVFGSDQERPWLHEGDAEWAALNAMHEAGLFSDASFAAELETAVNMCLLARGEAPAATLPPGRNGKDDPYACGVAIQLLGWAQRHDRHPDAADSALLAWGALHRAHPQLDAAGFAQFFDEAGSHAMRDLLLDGKTPFSSTYRSELARLVAVQDSAGEPASPAARYRTAAQLMRVLVKSDCGRLGFSGDVDKGEVRLDPDLGCHALPEGARITTVAGAPVFAQPRAAWSGVKRSCADGRDVRVGLAGHDPVALACPAALPDPPPQVRLPADALQRLALTPGAPMRNASTAATPATTP